MSTQAVEITIFGRTLRVNCPQGQEDALLRAAEDVDKRLQELAGRTKVSNTEQLVTIAALNLCYELHSERNKNADDMAEMTQRINMLQTTIEQALLSQSKS
ncbi:cell division protein ZapA [Parasalinivibrio latis]|uniref:cell division protein ZapA n=1 Tax=Parasalinivibrio latis TaxID=2952610 RepID=UPI0030E0F236